ncbi:hypothetical protein QNZ73_004771 [Vibrio parahaemolyticus]|nr:hypothetical protein [Vibrio parahaemolyticus]ELB2100252.1 hypothetical protein [Vibrio parahaemolyticus]ELB2209976.1 hypothetical protein [Vibrio parahaemolyticus]ELB2291837.1 hypothetical protein [Vibrio parahaemolyticus]
MDKKKQKQNPKFIDNILLLVVCLVGIILLFKSIYDFTQISKTVNTFKESYVGDFSFAYISFLYGVIVTFLYHKRKIIMRLFAAYSVVLFIFSALLVAFSGYESYELNKNCAETLEESQCKATSERT